MAMVELDYFRVFGMLMEKSASFLLKFKWYIAFCSWIQNSTSSSRIYQACTRYPVMLSTRHIALYLADRGYVVGYAHVDCSKHMLEA